MLEPHQIEALSQRRGDARLIDRALNYKSTGERARAFTREPKSTRGHGTGERSQFARCLDYLSARAAVRREAACILVGALRMHAGLVTAVRRGRSRVELAVALLKQATRAAEALVGGGPTADVQRELLKLESVVVECDYELTPTGEVQALKQAQARPGNRSAYSRAQRRVSALHRELRRA